MPEDGVVVNFGRVGKVASTEDDHGSTLKVHAYLHIRSSGVERASLLAGLSTMKVLLPAVRDDDNDN